jgi:hypothetical protein
LEEKTNLKNGIYYENTAGKGEDMIIEIEGYQIEAFVYGKKCSGGKLYRQMKKTIKYMENSECFVSMFCRLFGYEKLEDSDNLLSDYIIDVDIEKVLKGSAIAESSINF